MSTASTASDNSDYALAKLTRHEIDPDSPTPLYYQLYTMLHDAITSGELPRGSRMPSEKELALNFDVSRITARRALDELALKKMVARHRGRGTFVDYRYQPDTIHAPLDELMKSIDHMWRDTSVEVLELDFTPPPRDIRDTFDASEDEVLCHQVRVRSKQEMPFAYYITWTRGFNRKLTRGKLERTPRVELLKSYGIEFARVEQFLTAESASPEISKALGISTGKALLKLSRYSYDADGELLDKLVALYNTDLFVYKMETMLDQ